MKQYILFFCSLITFNFSPAQYQNKEQKDNDRKTLAEISLSIESFWGSNDEGIALTDITKLIETYIKASSIDLDTIELSPVGIIGHFFGLPVITINTPNGYDITSRGAYMEQAHILIYDPQGHVTLETQTKIRGRGNTSWSHFPKKSYKLKFYEKQSLFGEHEDKTWGLLANHCDKTFLRNDLAFQMRRHLSNLNYTSSSHFVGLILNNKFLGLYQVAEQTKLKPYRVDVGNDGFLLEFDARATDEDVHFEIPHIPFPTIIKDQTADNLSATDSAYCAQYVHDADSVLFSPGYTDETEGYAQYLDILSFVDWMLINEIAKNNDAIFYSSCYMSLSRGGKLKMGPVWDFDIAFGNVNYNDNDSPEGLWIRRRNPWYKRLLTDKRFAQKTIERFNHFYAHKETIIEYIKAQSQKTLRNPTYLNNRVWGILGTYVWSNPVWFDTYEEEVNHMKSWLITRLEWLKNYYGQLPQ